MFLIKTFLTHFTYLALILVLVIAGLGVPIPEDIPLLFSGYLCNPEHSPITQITTSIDTDGDGKPDTVVKAGKHVPHIYLMITAGMIGVLLGDSIVFNIGRKGVNGNHFAARHIRKVLHSKRREKVERHFARHGNLTVFVGRFMPGFRSIVFAFAGMSRMSYFRFLLIDGLAALISVPVFIVLGYYFADRFNWLMTTIDRFKEVIFPIVLVLVLGAILLYLIRKRRAARLQALSDDAS